MPPPRPTLARPQWVPTYHLPAAGPGDTLTAAARTFLLEHDLDALWANADGDQPATEAMEGFYGPDHYRIAFYFDEVHRDLEHPEQYLVSGRNRCRKVITPFWGTITVQAIFRAELGKSFPHSDSIKSYVVRAHYEPREDPTTKGAGMYVGEAMLDLYEEEGKGLYKPNPGQGGYYRRANPNQGGGSRSKGFISTTKPAAGERARGRPICRALPRWWYWKKKRWPAATAT